MKFHFFSFISLFLTPTFSYRPPLNQLTQPPFLVSIKNKQTYSDANRELFIENNDHIRDKKIITISPGGVRGFYMFGVCKYIKQHYHLDNYVFSGASAGAWMSLFLSFRGNMEEIQKHLVDLSFLHTKSIYELENLIKYRLLSKYNSDDFDLDRMFVGTTTLDRCFLNTTVYYDFHDLENAIDACMASSHIPVITGGFRTKFNGLYTFDGGFSKYPHLDTAKPTMHITPFIWDKLTYTTLDIKTYATMFSNGDYNFLELIEQGYFDTFENKEYMDKILS